ncbi:uncharacterized protein LOC135939238 [Cloeon dipterum]|uniref:uncharacterized protein LOC135939238 n=1 Tax=Cloeon dipterum TaxID=197152 RepID=UPI00321FA0CC
MRRAISTVSNPKPVQVKGMLKNNQNFPRRRKATYFFAFLFSMAYLCLLIFAPSLRMGFKKSAEQPSLEQERERAQRLLLSGRHDASGRYRILSFVFQGTRWAALSMNASSVCVATQICMDQLDSVPPFVDSAPGAVSVALFVPRDQLVSALVMLQYLRLCSRNFREKASVHFIVPHGQSLDQNVAETAGPLNLDCRHSAGEVLQAITAGRQLKLARPPAGMLRNVGLEHCHNEWRASIDPHMLFPETLGAAALADFLATRDQAEKSAFVLPEYVLVRGEMPKNRAELLSHFLDGKVRPKGDNEEAYAASLLQRWQRHGATSSSRVEVAFKLLKFNFAFQPAFVTKLGSPRFDERYSQDAMAKFSQVYEMLMLDYQFYVLDNAYLCGYRDEISTTPLSSDLHIFHESHLSELISRYERDPLALLKHDHMRHGNLREKYV